MSAADFKINCDRARDYLPLFLYSELSFEEEEAFQTHLSTCEECRMALEAERHLHAALNDAEQDAVLPAGLLTGCREALAGRIATEQAAAPASNWMSRATDLLSAFLRQPWMRPVGALAMLALGFAAGRLINNENPVRAYETPVAEPVATRVSRVDRDGSGRFQVVVDETRQRVVTGAPDDDQIRRLLISASGDPADAGLRGETIEMLSAVPACDETRRALLTALETDPNDGVRLRALQGLKGMANQSDVRRVLAHVLVKDRNAGVRTQAIDLLTEGRANLSRENDIVSVFQDLMGREQNDYIRMRVQRQLQLVKASTEVY